MPSQIRARLELRARLKPRLCSCLMIKYQMLKVKLTPVSSFGFIHRPSSVFVPVAYFSDTLNVYNNKKLGKPVSGYFGCALCKYILFTCFLYPSKACRGTKEAKYGHVY